MTATDMMPSELPKCIWLHILRAALVAPIVPDAGSRYLGMPPKGRATTVDPSPLGALAAAAGWLLVLLIFVLQNYDINALMLCAAAWLVIGLWSGIKMAGWVKAHPQDVRTVPFSISGGTIGNLIWMPVVVLLFLGQGSVPTYFFRAGTGTPLAKAGDILYALDFSRSGVDIGRGQLLLADLDSNPTLVRVIGIPGDMVGIGSYAIHVNAITIRIGASPGRDRSDARSYLSDIAGALAYPGDTWRDTEMVGSPEALLSKDPVILSGGRYMVALDDDILAPRLAYLPTTIISSRDIIAVPWAKIGFLQGMPGHSSGIAQPVLRER